MIPQGNHLERELHEMRSGFDKLKDFLEQKVESNKKRDKYLDWALDKTSGAHQSALEQP